MLGACGSTDGVESRFPRALRNKLGLEPRDDVTFIESREDLVLRKKRAAPAESGIRKWVGRLERMPERVDEFIDVVRGS